MNIIMTRLLPPMLDLEGCYNEAVKRLNDPTIPMNFSLKFADGVLWGVGKQEMVCMIPDRESLKDMLIDMWEHMDVLDSAEKRAFILICKEIAWELDPRNTREEDLI